MTTPALVGLVAIVLMAPHITKREAGWLAAIHILIGVVLLAYAVAQP